MSSHTNHWWRAHHGISNDAKLQFLATRAGVKRCEIGWVWVILVDFASQNEPRGSTFGLSLAEIAFMAEIPEKDVSSIINAMKERGMIQPDGMLSSWSKRQPQRERDEGDRTAADRQRKFRQKLKEGGPSRSSNYMRYFPVVFERDGGHCVYCGEGDRELLGLDHGVPLCLGGDGDVMNLYLSCRKCNSGKSGRTPEQARYPFRSRETADLFKENQQRLSLLAVTCLSQPVTKDRDRLSRSDVTACDKQLDTSEVHIIQGVAGCQKLPVTPSHAQRRGEESRGEYITPLTPQGGIEEDAPLFPAEVVEVQATAINGNGKRPKESWYDKSFEEWYTTAYWCRTAKKVGRKAYAKALNRKVDKEHVGYNQAKLFLTEMANGYRVKFEHHQSWDWRQNIHPATWLNGENWTDESPQDASAPRKDAPPPKPIKTVPYDPMALWKAQKLAEQQEEEQLEVKVQ